ncbi:hypothetical protein EW145_g2405 [Phellinidium pouzarii]|uniref:Uncharacterized protein n=1 Tax=Phellinidium pouzarii TaxID=167371 RepID=A0A4S4LGF1_9AGAM|nr:hypothetical protein EW145_g2405 [Phellinidium pouzarii]
MAIAHSSRTMTLPVEIWREIIRLATTAPDSLSSSNLNAGEAMIEFNWPSNLPCRMPCPDSFSTKHALALTSYQFWQLSCEFLYETIYIRNVEHARYLASSPALQGALGKWTKNIIITPVFEDDISHTKFSPLAREFGNAVVRVLACCTKLQSVVVRADAVSKRLVLYEQWMKICSAVPQGVRHLDIDDDIFAPSRWEPFGKKK